MALADMAGALFVADIERGAQAVKRLDDKTSTFLELPFDEAIEFFENRFQDKERAQLVINKYRDGATGASERTLQKIAEKIVARLNTTLTNGGTLAEFIAEFEGTVIGDEILEAGYLENVYRSNIQSAYGAGRVAQIEESIESIGFIEYVTVGDSRVRDTHAELDGKVWKASDPEWRRYTPPNFAQGFQYQCRCSVVTREQGEFTDAQLARTV